MAIFAKLFGRKAPTGGSEPAATEPVCPHTTPVPQWDFAADMGHEDRASRYFCGVCGESFTPAEFAALRASEAERLQHLMEVAPGGDDKGN